MLYSMTGFGQADGVVNSRQVSVELKSLNGKQFELSTRLPPVLRAYDLDIRTLLNSQLLRGTIDLFIVVRQDGASKPMIVNPELAAYYYQSMKQIAERLKIPVDNAISTLMRMPEVVTTEQDILPEKEWLEVKKIIVKAAEKLMEHRKHEGEATYKDLEMRIHNIETLLDTIMLKETERMEKIRGKLTQLLEDLPGKEKMDANRFEQEMIYYLERMDFSEEKIRLKQHCLYFIDTVNKKDIAIGRKLNFILQEIGREVNTLGSKANHAEIQQAVINMKDELEKAKEQVLNIL